MKALLDDFYTSSNSATTPTVARGGRVRLGLPVGPTRAPRAKQQETRCPTRDGGRTT